MVVAEIEARGVEFGMLLLDAVFTVLMPSPDEFHAEWQAARDSVTEAFRLKYGQPL